MNVYKLIAGVIINSKQLQGEIRKSLCYGHFQQPEHRRHQGSTYRFFLDNILFQLFPGPVSRAHSRRDYSVPGCTVHTGFFRLRLLLHLQQDVYPLSDRGRFQSQRRDPGHRRHLGPPWRTNPDRGSVNAVAGTVDGV